MNRLLAFAFLLSLALPLTGGRAAPEGSRPEGSQPEGLPPIRVLTLDALRSLPCGGTTFAFAESVHYAAARAELLDPANFGPNGVVPRAIELVQPVTYLLPATLIDVDVVLLNATDPPDAMLEPFELIALGRFVVDGGGLFVFANDAATYVGRAFLASSAVNHGSATFSFTNLTHPTVSGPFGAVSGDLTTNLWHGRFKYLGPFGTELLASDATMGAAFELGLGRAVAVNDEEWMLNSATCPAAPNWNDKSSVFLKNIMAWIAPPP